MNVKTFTAKDMRHALLMIRETMGSEAIILGNKRTANGVEVTVTLDAAPVNVPARASAPAAQAKARSDKSRLEQELERMQSESRNKAKAIERELLKIRKPVVNRSEELLRDRMSGHSAPVASNSRQRRIESDELTTLRKELNSMRSMLERQINASSWDFGAHNNPHAQELGSRLRQFGLNQQISKRLVQLAGNINSVEEGWEVAMAHFSGQIPDLRDNMLLNGGVYALVGPTGAGKTTTIGKLAARYVLEHGADEVALITTDTYRIAAHEQLRAIGRILDVPVKVLSAGAELSSVLSSLRRKSLILIDTAGMRAGSPELAEQLDTLSACGADIKTLLTIPANSQAKAMQASYQSYAGADLDGCIITKVDETVSLGEALGLTLEKRLPIAYYTNGQSIPDDVHAADVDALVDEALRLFELHQREDSFSMAANA